MPKCKKHKLEKTPGLVWGFFYVPRVTRDGGIFTADKKGYIFSEFFKILADENGKPLPPLVLKHPDHALNEYIQNYGLVAVVRDHEGNRLCFSKSRCNTLPGEFTARLSSFLKLLPS